MTQAISNHPMKLQNHQRWCNSLDSPGLTHKDVDFMEKIALGAALLILSGSAFAQYCVPPTIPNGRGGCTMNAFEKTGNESAKTPQPQVQAQNYWGAIVRGNGAVWAVTKRGSASSAEQAGISSCQQEGGGECKLLSSFTNTWVAIVHGDGDNVYWELGNLFSARINAMKACKRESSNCKALKMVGAGSGFGEGHGQKIAF